MPRLPNLLSGSAVVRASLLLFLSFFGCGCRQDAEQSPPLTIVSAENTRKVIAQGQLLPTSGIIQLFAQPGDPVQEIHVAIGERVEAGQTLAVMRSGAVRDAQRATLRQQQLEAERTQAAAIAAAESQVKSAKLNLEHVEARQQSVQHQSELLQLAERQVAAAEAVLKQLEQISSDPRTSEFVGQLEVDRQRLAVGESQLSLEEQRQSHRHAVQELEWGRRAAEAELEAAMSQLKSAEDSSAVKIIELQVFALEIEAAASEIVAPEAGVILAVNATKGEANMQTPLIEMANTEQLICEVEVNEMDAALVEVGQSAIIRSKAFPQPLSGKVLRKSPLVGRPQLRPLDPLARVDYRAVTAIIQLDPESSETARQWLQLQVEVEIAIP